MAEYDAAGTLLRRYVHGPGVDEPLVWYEGSTTTAKSWLYADHLGSIVGTANSAGTSTAIHSYGPFGEPNVTTGVRLRYTGQQYLGGLNLYHYKARFYSPSLGRFLQTDPIGTADDLNLYAYVGNNPVNFSDPSGEFANILIGGGTSVLMGGAIRYVSSGGNWDAAFDAKAIAIDAALGSVGIGLANKANAVWRARDLPVSIGTKLGAQTRTKFEHGVYIVESNSGSYVGQSGQISKRLGTHAANSRFGAGSAEAANDAMRLSVAGGKTSREVAEQRVLNSLGGPNSPGVLNRVNPVGGRPWLLGNGSLGVIDGIYVPGIGAGASGGVGALTGATWNLLK